MSTLTENTFDRRNFATNAIDGGNFQTNTFAMRTFAMSTFGRETFATRTTDCFTFTRGGCAGDGGRLRDEHLREKQYREGNQPDP